MRQEERLLRSLGHAIRARREALSLSQDEFAATIGMHRAYYSAIERGERNITLRLVLKVARGLKVRIADLMLDAGV
jgi:transcriptional regulator with XRE-family HTH domain